MADGRSHHSVESLYMFMLGACLNTKQQQCSMRLAKTKSHRHPKLSFGGLSSEKKLFAITTRYEEQNERTYSKSTGTGKQVCMSAMDHQHRHDEEETKMAKYWPATKRSIPMILSKFGRYSSLRQSKTTTTRTMATNTLMNDSVKKNWVATKNAEKETLFVTAMQWPRWNILRTCDTRSN